MRSIRGRRALRPLLVVLFPLHAAAADPAEDIAERAARLDQLVQALKDEVIELTVEAQSIENTVLVPEHLRVSVYLRVDVAGLLLEEVSVAIDDRAAEVHRFDDRDARAMLSEQAARRILRATVGEGAHRIRLQYRARFADDTEEDPPVTGSYEAIFDKHADDTDLEFTISRKSRFGDELRTSMKQWRRLP
ncbi:hypothetical protein [Sinimarinibacterium thermocellulolyticum]|uniref:Uncharacterized protein n=1 Tax=Sinimarinibacterium thermocellulolyticum TaxID=3170016 RepID=A0ABV2A562_9GAMM